MSLVIPYSLATPIIQGINYLIFVMMEKHEHSVKTQGNPSLY